MEHEFNNGIDMSDIESLHNEDSMSVDSDIKKQRKIMDDMKKMDKHFHKMKRIVNKKHIIIEYYGTPFSPGSKIRNAITGIRSDHKVGSLKENLYFKVINAVGDEKIRDPIFLYFDSPEQYERHFKCEVDKKTKKLWLKKFNDENHKNLIERKQ